MQDLERLNSLDSLLEDFKKLKDEIGFMIFVTQKMESFCSTF